MEPTSSPTASTSPSPDPDQHDHVEADAPLVSRYLTDGIVDPFDTVTWERRDARAGNFVQLDVEVPSFWTEASLGVVAKLYLVTIAGVKEDSIRQMIHRVAAKIAIEGIDQGHFGSRPGVRGIQEYPQCSWDFMMMLEVDDHARIFYDELRYVCLHQIAGFNTPTWLNLGVKGRRACGHACYPLSVKDHMLGDGGIVDWWRKEAMIFKTGGGAGINLSNIRGSMEPLSTGGIASGPLAYMRAANAAAETMKSGGAHRRAAKFVCLDVDHPDIMDFIWCKVREDERMVDLAKAGHDLSIFTPEGERNVAETTSFQSANNSVSISDDFMRAVESDDEWHLIARTTGEQVGESIKARDVLLKIAEAAWRCADPGVIFIDTINKYHTTPAQGPISTVNTCFVGETLVDTSEGRIPIEELSTMYATGQPLPYAFSFDVDDALPKLRRIQAAWMPKTTTDLVRVTTDKGVEFTCTPDHPVLVREHGRSSEGHYVAAGELVIGQRLRKIGRYVNKSRSSRRYLTHRVIDGIPNGTSCQAPWMWEQVYGPIPDGMEIHHLNEDPTDDRISNFELVDSGTHQSFHSAGERNGRFIEVDDRVLVELYEQAEQRKGLNRTGIVHYRLWAKTVEEAGLVGVVPRGNPQKIHCMTWPEFAVWVDERRSLVNDVVASVERISCDPTPVYDLTVEGTHNFAVATSGAEHTIVVSNCGEISQNDDTACNLAAINLIKFLGGDRSELFDFEQFRHVVSVMMTSMDIVNGFSELPTEEIERNTRALRQCGLGFTNFGAAIMAQGLPYDSDQGRDFGAAVTSLLTASAYRHSAVMASRLGRFQHHGVNAECMDDVLDKHVDSVPTGWPYKSDLWGYALEDWSVALDLARTSGYRNSLATAMMPTGTVSFLLGADTTGIEPALSLVTRKKLAASGEMVMINRSAHMGARALGGYSDEDLLSMSEGDFSSIATDHLPVFATAMGENTIEPMGHLRMVAAIQPHLSQAVSKTVNLPNSATVEDIYEVYMEAWRSGVKVISVYRDGSKATQVLTSMDKKIESVEDGMKVVEDLIEKVSKQPPAMIGETMSLGSGQPLPIDDPAYVSPNMSGPRAPRIHADEIENFVKDRMHQKIDGSAMKAWPKGQVGVSGPHSTRPHLDEVEMIVPVARRRLPRTRTSITHKIHVRSALGEHEGYITAGTYEDGALGEIFLEGFGRSGGFTQNALAAWATAFSIAIQYGTPWQLLALKHAGQVDETGGVVVPDPSGRPLPIRTCDSIVDYIARWLVAEFGDVDMQDELGVMTQAVRDRRTAALDGKVPTSVFPISQIVPTSWDGIEADPVGDVARAVKSMSEKDIYVYPYGGQGPEMIATNGNGHGRTVEISAQTCPECRQPLRRAGTCLQCSCGYTSGGCG